MGYSIYVEGCLEIEQPTQEEVEFIEGILGGPHEDKKIFHVSVEYSTGYISHEAKNGCEGLRAFSDYIDGPIEKLMKKFGSRVTGEYQLSSTESEYDNKRLVVNGVSYEIEENAIIEADSETLKTELYKRGDLPSEYGLLGLKPDLNSDIIIEDDKTVSVLMTGNVEQNFKLLFGRDTEYVDIYAFADPKTELVKKLQVIATFENDKDSITVEVTEPVQQVDIFMNIVAADEKGEFRKALTNAKKLLEDDESEYVGCVIDCLNDYLEEQGVILPLSKKAQIDEFPEEDAQSSYCSICAEDFDAIDNILRKYLDCSLDNREANAKWLKAYHKYASMPDSGVAEDDFVAWALERKINVEFVKNVLDEEKAEWFERVGIEHGLIAV